MTDLAFGEKGPMLNTPRSAPARHALGLAGLAVVLALLAPASVRAQENGDCLGCHGQKDFTAERKGRTVSLYVDEKAFAASIHGSLQCVDCHAELQGKELPHETLTRR